MSQHLRIKNQVIKYQLQKLLVTLFIQTLLLVEEKKNKATHDFIYNNYGYTKKNNIY